MFCFTNTNSINKKNSIMNTEVLLVQNYGANDAAVKCEFCLLTFRTWAEKNIHFLNHFQQQHCSFCQQNLIRIGDTWYSEHSEHLQPKTEPNTDEENEFTTESFVSIKPSDEVHENCIQNYSDPIFSDMVHSTFSGVHSKTQAEDELMDTDAESAFATENVLQPEQIILPEFIEQKPKDILHIEFINENESNEHVNDSFVDHTLKIDIVQNKIQVKPYKCASCDETFAYKRNLNRHAKRKNHIMESDSLVASRKSTTNVSARESNGIAGITPIESNNDVIERNDSNIVPFHGYDSVSIAITENVSNNIEAKEKTKSDGHICEICNRNFACSYSLKCHMNKHLGLEPYVCDYNGCGKAFADRRRMNDHKDMHIGPIECTFCKTSYTHLRSYKRHEPRCSAREKSKVQNNENVQDYGTYCDSVSSSNPIDWLCEYCNEDFEHEITLAKHIIKHHNEEKLEHPCNICAEIFSRPPDLLLHMRSHPEIGQYKCTFAGCEQGFAVKSSLGVHMSKHIRLNSSIERRTQEHISEKTKKELLNKETGNVENLYVCDICNKKFQSRAVLSAHLKWVHTNQRLKCSVDGCDKTFKKDALVVNHMRQYHPNSLQTCDVCQKEFYTDEQLAKHRSRHQRQFTCNMCDKKFAEKLHLRDHLRRHEKDATCNICGERFSTNKAMVYHRQRHGKKRILTCRFKDCNQVFEDTREFLRHSSTHPDSEKKKFICSYCGKAYTSKQYLNEHINTHKNERPFECKVCKKCFLKRAALRRHTQIHTGEKPYKCEIDGCGQAYRDGTDLKRHKFSVHNIYTKKHICPICEKVFPERKLLTKHTINTHGKIDSTAVEVQQ